VRPLGQGLSGELGLITAFLALVVEDAGSPNPALRTEALWFLADDQALAFWLDLAEIDHQAFRERIQHVQRAQGQG
jgi:hypothetical protein